MFLQVVDTHLIFNTIYIQVCVMIPVNIFVCVKIMRANHLSILPSHPGQLSLLPSAGREMSTSQSAVMLCGWEVKAPPPHHNRFTGLFPGPSGWAGARRELLDFMVQEKINRGRHTDHPAGRHYIGTNQCPPPPSPMGSKGRCGLFYLWINVWVTGETVWSAVKACHAWDEQLITPVLLLNK